MSTGVGSLASPKVPGALSAASLDAVAVRVRAVDHAVAVGVEVGAGWAAFDDVVDAVVVAIQVEVVGHAVAVRVRAGAGVGVAVAVGLLRPLHPEDAVAVRVRAADEAVAVGVGQAALDDVVDAVVVAIEIAPVRHAVHVAVGQRRFLTTKRAGVVVGDIGDAVEVKVEERVVEHAVTVHVDHIGVEAALNQVVDAVVVGVQILEVGLAVAVRVRGLAAVVGDLRGGRVVRLNVVGQTVGAYRRIDDAVAVGVEHVDLVGREAALLDVGDAVVVAVEVERIDDAVAVGVAVGRRRGELDIVRNAVVVVVDVDVVGDAVVVGVGLDGDGDVGRIAKRRRARIADLVAEGGRAGEASGGREVNRVVAGITRRAAIVDRGRALCGVWAAC